MFLLILASIILQFLRIGSNYWLAWATPSSRDEKPVVSGLTLMTIYAYLALGICFCTLVVDSLVTATGYKTATILFKKMLETIFGAPMSFFDATPSGRILNRCCGDSDSFPARVSYFRHDPTCGNYCCNVYSRLGSFGHIPTLDFCLHLVWYCI